MTVKKYNTYTLSQKMDMWDDINTSALSDGKREQYEKNKQAVTMYVNGQKLDLIESVTGVKAQNVTRMIRRCLMRDREGLEYGFRALIPGFRVVETRGDKTKYISFCSNHIDLLAPVIDTYIKGDSGYDRSQHTNVAFGAFIQALKESGLTDMDYPFTLSDYGRRNFYNLITKLEEKSEIGVFTSRLGEDAKGLIKSTGYEGQTRFRPPDRFMERVEIDGHKIDCKCCISYTDQSDVVRSVTIKRIWIIAGIDVATRAIVGFSVSVNAEYNRLDVMDCLESMVIPPELDEDEAPYLPNQMYPEVAFALPEEIAMDNAMANIATDVIRTAMRLHAPIKTGPVASPTGRPHIERFFGTLENAVHRLPSTTGSNPRDPRRRDPDKDAIKHAIALDDIKEIVKAGIRDYNNKVHSQKIFSPFEMVQSRISKGVLPAFIPEKDRDGIKLVYLEDTRIVRGSSSTGHTPYIQYENCTYTSQKLKGSFSMLGETLHLQIDPHDVSTITAYRDNGEYYDTLLVGGEMRGRSITLHQLKLLNKTRVQMMASDAARRPSVDEVIEYIKSKSPVSKKAATELANLGENVDLNRKQEIKPPEEPRKSTVSKESKAVVKEEPKSLLSRNEQSDLKAEIDNLMNS